MCCSSDGTTCPAETRHGSVITTAVAKVPQQPNAAAAAARRRAGGAGQGAYVKDRPVSPKDFAAPLAFLEHAQNNSPALGLSRSLAFFRAAAWHCPCRRASSFGPSSTPK